MRLTLQKRIAADILKCSPKRIWIDPVRTPEVKEAVTKQDIRTLVNNGLIVKKQKNGQSKFRARKTADQKRKGRRQGVGSRKGAQNARTPRKLKWMNSIRLQRSFLRDLRNKNILNVHNYRELLLKAKGGFFRSERHIKIYINEHDLVEKKWKTQDQSYN